VDAHFVSPWPESLRDSTFQFRVTLLAAMQWPSRSYSQSKRAWFQWNVAATLFFGVLQRHPDR
jgi:hypothetical protein